MKRKPLIIAIALLLVVGAALWGVNYRLDHPPLTKADKEFRAMVAGANRVEITSMICNRNSCRPDNSKSLPQILNAQQARELVDLTYFLDSTKNQAFLWNEPVKRGYMFKWILKGDRIVQGEIRQTQGYSATDIVGFKRFYPRSEKRFWRYLNQQNQK